MKSARHTVLCWFAVIIVIGLVHCEHAICAAQPVSRRIALVNVDREFALAAQTALAAWQLESVAVEDPGLASVRSDATLLLARLRVVAREQAASAVVWMSERAVGAELSVYDYETDRILGTRPTPAPPFDAATAAAVVLTVKTLLRHSAAAPARVAEAEGANVGSASEFTTLGVNPGAEPTAAVAAAPAAPVAQASLPQAERAEAKPATAANSGEDAATQPSAASRADSPVADAPAGSELEIAALGGIRSAVQSVGPEARFGASTVLWPEATAFGLGLSVSAGSGFRATDPRLDARLVDPALALAVLWRVRISSAWRTAASLGAALQLTHLRGELTTEARRAVDITRITPQLQLELHVDWRVAKALFVGVRAHAGLALVRQRYWVDEQAALESRTLAFGACLAIGIPLRL